MTTKKSDHLDHSQELYASRIEVTTRPNGTRRIKLDVSEPKLTDQSMKKETDINNILKRYAAQGATPQMISDPSYFRDNTDIPSIEEAFNITNRAIEAFSELHPTLRKLMDNDPSNLEHFLSDPDNKDTLIKYGVFVEPKKETVYTPGKITDPEPKAPTEPKV